MEIPDSADTARRSIEKLGGNGLRQGVVSFFLESAHEVVSVLGNHAEKFRYFVRTVLKVARRALAVVTTEGSSAYMFGIFLGEFLHYFPRFISRAVVDKYHFIRESIGLHHTVNPCVKLRQRFFLII